MMRLEEEGREGGRRIANLMYFGREMVAGSETARKTATGWSWVLPVPDEGVQVAIIRSEVQRNLNL